MRDGDENKKSHVILEQSLQDEKWIETVSWNFLERENL